MLFNKNQLRLRILNPRILCIVGKVVRFHMSWAELCSTLAEKLLDKTCGTIGRRRGSSPSLDGLRIKLSGVGIHLIQNTPRRCRKDGSVSNTVYQKSCGVCKGGHKSKHFCSDLTQSTETFLSVTVIQFVLFSVTTFTRLTLQSFSNDSR